MLFLGAPTEVAEVGSLSDGVLTPWRDGDEVAFQWGFQGGVMITPSVRAPRTITRDGAGCVLVEIEHLEPGGGRAFDGFRSFRARLDAIEAGESLQLERLFDQLAWSAIPAGTPLTLDVTVRGTLGAAHARVELTIVPPSSGLPAHCDSLPTHGTGCQYRSLPATGRVTSIRPRTDEDYSPTCAGDPDDPQIVEIEAEVDEGFRDCAREPTRSWQLTIQGHAVPRACLDALALDVGSTLPVTIDEIFVGGCAPYNLRAPLLDAAACTAACLGD